MSGTQRARSSVPLADRSVVPTIPGIPWWGAVAAAGGATLVGTLVDRVSTGELGAGFSAFYVLGCVAAVAAVRYRHLFTTLVLPPLLMLVGVVAAQQFVTGESGGGLKDLALNIAFPFITRFPIMLLATALVAIVGGWRILDARRQPSGASAHTARARSRAGGERSRRRGRDDARRAEPARGRTRRRATVAAETPVDQARRRAEAVPTERRRADHTTGDRRRPAAVDRADTGSTRASVRDVADTRSGGRRRGGDAPSERPAPRRAAPEPTPARADVPRRGAPDPRRRSTDTPRYREEPTRGGRRAAEPPRRDPERRMPPPPPPREVAADEPRYRYPRRDDARYSDAPAPRPPRPAPAPGAGRRYAPEEPVRRRRPEPEPEPERMPDGPRVRYRDRHDPR